MFKTSFQVARVFGIPIRLDLSLLVLMGIIWFDTLRAGLGLLWSFLLGGAYALLLLLSIVLHELGHSLVSMRFGCRVRGITLMLLGGRAELSHLPTQPLQELAIAVAGPLVSLALWLGGRFGAASIERHGWLAAGLLALLPGMLATLNACLFWFNLIPAFPMDGGRVLRALLAHRLGRLRATRIAANLGRALAAAAIVWALMPGPARIHFEAQHWELGGQTLAFGPVDVRLDGFMLALIALFIFQAAGQEYRFVQIETACRENGVRPPWVPPPPPDGVVVSPPPYRRADRDRTERRHDGENTTPWP
jgi:Zn-dependent protease